VGAKSSDKLTVGIEMDATVSIEGGRPRSPWEFSGFAALLDAGANGPSVRRHLGRCSKFRL